MTYPTYLQSYEVFPFAPLTGCKETLQTKTYIIRGRDGSEQRIGVRSVPRQGFDFSIFLNNPLELSYLQNILFNWQKGYWALPIWVEKTLHTDSISAGASTITFDTSYADYRSGTLAIIWQGYLDFDVVKIDTVYPTYLSLNGVTSRSFTGTKFIMPCRLAQMITPSSGLMDNRAEGKHQFSFLVVDNVLLTGHTPAVEYPTYSGANAKEVVETPSLVEEEVESDADISIQDYDIGDFEYFSESDFNILSRTYRRRNVTKQECWEFRQWLHSFYGKQDTKWFPTFKDDFTLISAIGPSDTSFEIQNVGLADNVGVNTLRNNIAFISGSNLYYRQIYGITGLTNGNEEVTIASSLGATIGTNDIVCFLDRCRLASNEIEILWETGNENVCNLTLIVVKE